MENSLSIEAGEFTLNGAKLINITDFKMETQNFAMAKVSMEFLVPFTNLDFCDHPKTDKSASQQ